MTGLHQTEAGHEQGGSAGCGRKLNGPDTIQISVRSGGTGPGQTAPEFGAVGPEERRIEVLVPRKIEGGYKKCGNSNA